MIDLSLDLIDGLTQFPEQVGGVIFDIAEAVNFGIDLFDYGISDFNRGDIILKRWIILFKFLYKANKIVRGEGN